MAEHTSGVVCPVGVACDAVRCRNAGRQGTSPTQEEIVKLRQAHRARPGGCADCVIYYDKMGMAPSFEGSRKCESGSIASGGDRWHCTCDRCF